LNANVKKSVFLVVALIIIALFIYSEQMNQMEAIVQLNNNLKEELAYQDDSTFKIISSTENEDLEIVLEKFALDNNIDLDIEYAGTIEIMNKLNSGEKYDAVWTSNSIWMYMLNSEVVTTSDSKSTSINPVVFGVNKTKAQDLGLIGKELYTRDIVNLIKERKIKI